MFIFDKAPTRSCHASTIVEVDKGKFLAAWFGGTDEGKNDVKIWLARYASGVALAPREGTKWSKPEMVAQDEGYPCWNPVLFRDQSKTLHLFYKAGPKPSNWSGFVKRSTDGGNTWSKEEVFPAGLLGPIKNKPIQLADGTILAGTSVEAHRAWTSWVERSKDDGKTWQRFGPIAVPDQPHGIIQPTLLETSDKLILALCRSNDVGFICQAESKDRGETWSAAKPTELLNPNSGIDAVRTAQGDFFLVYNPTKSSRTPLHLARSADHGKTWKKVAVLEDAFGEFSYPAIIQAQDGSLHITYTWNRVTIKHLVLDAEKLRK